MPFSTQSGPHCAALAALLLAGSSLASEPKSSIEELFLGESAFTQERDESQLTVGAEFSRAEDGNLLELSAEFEYGISDRLQFGVEVPYKARAPVGAGEFADLEIGAAVRLLQKGNGLLSLSVEVELPTGPDPSGESESTEWTPSLLYGAMFGAAEFHAGLGADIDAGNTELNYQAALVIPGQRLSAVAEVSYAEDESYLLAGIVVSSSSGGQLNLGVPVGIGRSSGEWGIMLAGTWEF